MEELKKLMQEGFAELGGKIDKVEQRMDTMEQRMDGMEQRMEQRMDTMEQRMEQRMDGVEQRIGGVEQRIGGVEQRMDTMAQALAQVDGRLTNVEAATAAIQDSQIRMEQEMQRNFGALYDARELQIDVNEKMICALTRIESKLERADLRALYSANKLIRQG